MAPDRSESKSDARPDITASIEIIGDMHPVILPGVFAMSSIMDFPFKSADDGAEPHQIRFLPTERHRAQFLPPLSDAPNADGRLVNLTSFTHPPVRGMVLIILANHTTEICGE